VGDVIKEMFSKVGVEREVFGGAGCGCVPRRSRIEWSPARTPEEGRGHDLHDAGIQAGSSDPRRGTLMQTARETEVRDWFVPFLLLCMRGGDLQGHELMDRLADLGFSAVRPGEIYRTLRRAEEEGLIFSEKESLGYLLSQRRYGLTEPGKAYIEFLADSLKTYRDEIEAFLLAYADRPRREAYG
jgi:PadR family transcriptional regulator, regulatory protein PadR